MPALNIRFTDDELATLRRRAEIEDMPVTKLVHDAVMLDTDNAARRARWTAALDEVAQLDGDVIKGLAER